MITGEVRVSRFSFSIFSGCVKRRYLRKWRKEVFRRFATLREILKDLRKAKKIASKLDNIEIFTPLILVNTIIISLSRGSWYSWVVDRYHLNDHANPKKNRFHALFHDFPHYYFNYVNISIYFIYYFDIINCWEEDLIYLMERKILFLGKKGNLLEFFI